MAKQVEAVSERELVFSYIFVDRNAFDVLHDQVRKSLVGEARIEQSRNIWMGKIGKDLSLCGKSDEKTARAPGSALHQLDRYLLLVELVGTAREIHLAHAALPDQADHFVVADALPTPLGTRRDALGGRLPWLLKKSPCLVGRVHQKFDLRP